MNTLPLTLVNWLLALSPIAAVLVLMVGFRWGGARAGPVGWLVALAVGVLFFGATPEVLAYSQLKGVLLTVYVLYIIWMALALYHLVDQAGAIAVIGEGITRLTGDQVMQILILGWVFSAFLQGVAGFGVPIAVVAPLLIGLGFSPVVAVSAVAIGHSWSVTFGDIASSFQALIAATGLSGHDLAPWSATFLGIACFGCGLAAAHAFGGWRALRHSLLAVLVVGLAMSATQYALATSGLWNLAGFVAGMVGLMVGAWVARWPFYQKPGFLPGKKPGFSAEQLMSLGQAVAPYVLLIVLVTAAELIEWRERTELRGALEECWILDGGSLDVPDGMSL